MPKRLAGETERRFGSLVKTLRETKRFTQEDFAHHIGIDRSYQGRIERGEASVTLHKLGLIAKGLDLPKWELLKKLEEDDCSKSNLDSNSNFLKTSTLPIKKK